MDIYILRDGKETGPFTEEATQSMLKQGSILINDLAWRPGMPNWQPLHAVLYPAAQPDSVRPPPPPADLTPPPMPSAPGAPPVGRPRSPAVATVPKVVAVPSSESGVEPATARQKAFLSYMGIAIPPDLTREKAALLINDEMENPKDAGRLQRWNQDRFRLHPDLFADEIKTKKENRANFFHEVCQGEGAEFFEKVTKAHTQVLVDYLDKRYPNWDARDDEAKYNYLFPAIAEKFPQLVKRGAKGRFKYPEGPKVAPELSRRSAVVGRHAPRSSPAGAIARGVIFGAIILGAIYFGVDYYKNPRVRPAATNTTSVQPSETKAGDKLPPVDSPESSNTASNASFPGATRDPFPSENPVPSGGKPDESAAPNSAPARPGEAKAPPPPGSNPVANMNLFGPDTAPSSTGSSPGVTTVSDPFNPLAPTAPVALPAPTPPPGPAPRATVKVTKPTLAALRFGSSMQRPGTILQLVGVEGSMVKVRIGPEIVSIPAANTDINDPEPAPAPPAPPAPAAPPP